MARIRSSAETKKSAVANAARDVDFKHLWRQLLSVGWQTKRPSGPLSNEWTYTSPSGQQFIGEIAVVAYALSNGISVDDEDSGGQDAIASPAITKSTRDVEKESQTAAAKKKRVPRSVKDNVIATRSKPAGELSSVVAHKGDEAPAGGRAMDEVMTASQIDTNIALSANTLSDLFGSDSDHESEPNTSDGHVIGAFQLLLSGAESNVDSNAGGISGGDASDGKEGSAKSDNESVVPISDVNVLSSGAISDDYEAVDSSGSEDSENTDDVIERREFPEDDVLSDEEVAHMDDAFIESMGGNLTLEGIDKSALRDLAWGPLSYNFEDTVNEYPNLCTDEAKPKAELLEIADSPMQLLFFFLPKELWVRITKETNRYNSQTRKERANRIRVGQRKRQAATPETVKQIEAFACRTKVRSA